MDRNKIAKDFGLDRFARNEVFFPTAHGLRATVKRPVPAFMEVTEWSNPNDSKPCFCGSARPNGRSFCADCETAMRSAANA